ncbi:hypothetical protein GE061_003638 [Apolygus lucorum]|uniref:Ketosynthase family 3 (KS3) domain-containing protein n=1 Tax=Apolygus lucorum TaxID=248454 RepID=A0A8S9X239_APOLU|nr:hypothetical protein GE061_003638 [Apolygus lucorum]
MTSTIDIVLNFASPIPEMREHEVVISGIAGIFPECDDVDELWSKLISKDDGMITEDLRRWVPGELGVPAAVGKLREPDHFDMSFFGVSRRLCINMDPITKLCMEQSFRAVCDAGLNPAELSGTNTAVLMASVVSETEYDSVIRGRYMGHAMLGHSRTMQANRISYFMNLKGPSLMMDSSWCGGVQGLQYAWDLISQGHVTSALVGACSMIRRPEVSIHYQGMGKLSRDGKTRSFSADASGYARSEGCVVFLLQRKDHARRSYGSILSAISINLASRTNPFTEISEEEYRKVLLESYRRAKASPEDLAYLEACGVGSVESDSRELRAVSDALLKKRNRPLMVGSIKSNLGHCEGASSMVSAIKAVMVLDRGVIPPNLHYSSPNPKVPALASGKLKVVTEPTPVEGTLAASTDFGAAAQFSHLVLKRFDKVKKHRCQVGELPPDGLPRLVLMSDRTESNLIANRERLNEMAIDEELVCLMNHVYKDGIKGHMYRGYIVLNGQVHNQMQVDELQDVETRRPVWFMFSGMGSQWPAMGKSLMRLPVFANAVHKCHDILAPKGVSVLDILTKDDAGMFDTILHSFVGIAAVQIGLVDVLKALGVEPDGIVGHSVGELGCAYADGCFTAEQMILSAYARGRASVEAELIKGMMAAVGKGYHQMKNEIPESIEVACHNSSSSCTLSGPATDMEAYIKTLKDQGVFAKLVNVANIAYHSRYIKPAAPALLKYLKEVIPEPKPRSARWISSSIPEAKWNGDLAQTSSAEYHTNNLLGSVLFEEASAHIPDNAIVIEIAPHGLLQAIVRKSLPSATHIPLTSKFEEDNLMYLLGAVGKMYIQGIPVNVQQLYPPVEFPVSRETPAISPFIGWEHNEEFEILESEETTCRKFPGWKEVNILLTEEKYSNLENHKIKERIILSPSFYVDSILKVHHEMERTTVDSVMAIDSFDYRKDVEVVKSKANLFAQLHRGTGNFCFFHDETLAVKGVLSKMEKFPTAEEIKFPLHAKINSGEEIVSFMSSMGLQLSGHFAAIRNFSIDNHILRAVVAWTGSLTEFLNSAFLLVEFYMSKKEALLQRVTQAVKIIINFPVLSTKSEVVVEYDAISNFINSDSLQVLIPQTSTCTLSSSTAKNVDYSLETYQFIPFVNPDVSTLEDSMYICSQLVVENLGQPKEKSCTIRVVGIGENIPSFQALSELSHAMKSQHVLHFSSFTTEHEFYQRDMSFVHQEIIWIISESRPSLKLLQSLHSALAGFILMPTQKPNESYNDINIISEFVHGDESYQLASSLKKKEKNHVIVELDENYLSVLEKELVQAANNNWKVDQEKYFVILSGKLSSITSTVSIMEEADNLPHSNLLKFVFMDGEEPTILSNNPYDRKILRDVRQNIYMNGVWGTFRLLSTELKENESSSIKAEKKLMYPLSSVVEDTDISTVGLNLTDVTATLLDDDLGVFDYVNSKVMGIAEYDAGLKALKPDKILKWNKPATWTDSEAASVPLLYSMATISLYCRKNALEMDKSILITRGTLPFSQAIITLLLHDQEVSVEELFVTAGGEDEKNELMILFPKLKRENIIDHGKNDVDIQLKHLTKGKGVSRIVCNFEDNERTVRAMNSVPFQYGTVILASQAPMDGRSKLGLLKFLYEALVVGVTADILMKSSDEEKIQIRNKVQSLIDDGAVKPLRTFSGVSPSALNVDVVETIRNSKSKVIVNVKDNSLQCAQPGKFICDKTKNCIIICGQRQLDLWLDLVRWLLKRDARKVTVFLTQTALPTVENLRLQSIMDQNYGAKINLVSMKHIASKTSMTRFFSDLESKEVDTIFFVGTDLRGTIQEIDSTLRSLKSKCRIVCLGHGGETVCQKRNEEGLDSLCVRCDSEALCSPDVLQYLEHLIIKSRQQPVVLLTEHVSSGCNLSNSSSADSFHLPETLPELIDLLRLTSETQPKFVEMTTQTMRLPHIKEIHPVFVFPGIKPNQTQAFCEQLYHPALEARIPEHVNNIEDMVSKLVEQMLARKIKLYTLVAVGWGCILALHIGARLEALGKITKLIFLDGTPEVTTRTASDLLRDETALIDKYLKLSSKAESEVRGKTSWPEKLKAATDLSGLPEDETRRAVRALNLFRNRLQAVVNSKPPANKIRTKCNLIKFGWDVMQTEKTGFLDYLTKDHILHMVGGETVEENMILAADEVNPLILFEYSDAANEDVLENRMNVNIFKNIMFDC